MNNMAFIGQVCELRLIVINPQVLKLIWDLTALWLLVPGQVSLDRTLDRKPSQEGRHTMQKS